MTKTLIFMDRILGGVGKANSVSDLGGASGCASLLFADDVVLLASLFGDLLHTLERFAVECEAAVMKISTSKFEAMVLCCKSARSGWVGVAAPSQRLQVSWGFVL